MFNFLQILILFIFSFSLISLFANKIIRRIISLFLSLFISLQCYSLYFGDSLIDSKFYKHFNFNDIKNSIGFFWKESILLILLIGLIFYLFIFLYKKYAHNIKSYFLVGSLILGLVLMSLTHGVFNNLYQISKLNSVEDKTINQALINLGIQPEDYTFTNQLEVTKGKNIIVISLESYEKGYLQENFKTLTPNLQRLKSNYQYFDMNQNDGGQWTTGSMYTYLTGVPMYLKGANNALENVVESKLTGIGSILNEAGYKQLYLLGNPGFGGSDDLIKANGIDVFPQSYFNEKYGSSTLGLHDYDLFAEAKEHIVEFSNNKAPFAIYMSTISTHFPNGIYDERMESHITKKDSDMQFMVASVDYLINDLIDFLEKQNQLDNTVFYIFPDHHLMGSGSGVVDKFNERGLFLITNAKKDYLEFVKKGKPIEQIDLAKIIVDGAEIKHNAKFLTEFITEDVATYLDKNVEKLLALNEASLRIDAFNSDFKIKLKSFSETLPTNNFTLYSRENNMQFVTDSFAISASKYHAFIFDKYMKVKHLKSNNKAFTLKSFNNQSNVLIDIVDSTNMVVFVRKGNAVGNIKQINTKEVDILEQDIRNLKLIEAYDFDKLNKLENSFYKLNNQEGTLYLTSSPNSFTQSTPTYIALNDKTLKHHKGLNVIRLNNPEIVENYNIYESENTLNNFISTMKKLIDMEEKFVVISHQPEKIESIEAKDALKNIGFNDLRSIRKKRSYICYSEGGVLIEKIGRKPISIQLDVKKKEPNYKQIKKNPARFIAHAGGKIDNITYTNSLEALTENYKKGFRYFELDILKTADNKFVAAHDWKKWRKNHGFQEDEPITHEIFMSRKAKNKFTPLSIAEINAWFKNHPDAILVTDKVNTPKQFSEAFNFKSRLIMELFSAQAIKEANKHQIKFLAAPNVFKGMNETEQLDFIKSNNVKYLSISRNSITKNRVFYKKLKNLGVKLYAYHISFKMWSDEPYVFINELDYIYGMYADEWQF